MPTHRRAHFTGKDVRITYSKYVSYPERSPENRFFHFSPNIKVSDLDFDFRRLKFHISPNGTFKASSKSLRGGGDGSYRQLCDGVWLSYRKKFSPISNKIVI